MIDMFHIDGELVCSCAKLWDVYVPECPWHCPCAYAEGRMKPNYPVPSTLGVVDLEPYPYIVCINRPDGDDWVIAWDFYEGDDPVILREGEGIHWEGVTPELIQDLRDHGY